MAQNVSLVAEASATPWNFRDTTVMSRNLGTAQRRRSVDEEAQQVGPGQHADRLAVLDDQHGVGAPARAGRPRPAPRHPRAAAPGSCASDTESARCALPVNSASSRSRSDTAPATSPDITGGSALTTGICDTWYSRRISMASRRVSCRVGVNQGRDVARLGVQHVPRRCARRWCA